MQIAVLMASIGTNNGSRKLTLPRLPARFSSLTMPRIKLSRNDKFAQALASSFGGTFCGISMSTGGAMVSAMHEKITGPIMIAAMASGFNVAGACSRGCSKLQTGSRICRRDDNPCSFDAMHIKDAKNLPMSKDCNRNGSHLFGPSCKNGTSTKFSNSSLILRTNAFPG